MHDFQFGQNKVLSRNLRQLTLAEVPCFDSTEYRVLHFFKSEWTLVPISVFVKIITEILGFKMTKRFSIRDLLCNKFQLDPIT